MRITRENLLKIVKDTVDQRTRVDRGIAAIYLSGSLLEEEFLLGGTADIDLFMIHADTVTIPREIVHLTDEVHLDIAHLLYRDFRQVRTLRVHPWLGPVIKTCKILFDPQHFLDFTQAGVRGQFDRPDYVVERARRQAEGARQVWLSFHEHPQDPGPADIQRYLAAAGQAANAIAGLNGIPLTERRMLLKFPARAEAVGRPGLAAGLLGLLGAANVDRAALQAWLPAWLLAFQAAAGKTDDPRLHPARQAYYHQGMAILIREDQPLAVLWPLLRLWTRAIEALPPDDPNREPWEKAMLFLGLYKGDFRERIAALDAYLDQIEETLDDWAVKNGV
jgi:hypothetical protein